MSKSDIPASPPAAKQKPPRLERPTRGGSYVRDRATGKLVPAGTEEA